MHQEAVEILEKAVKITPDNGEAHFLLAKAYEGIYGLKSIIRIHL